MPTDRPPSAPKHLSTPAKRAWREVVQPGERASCLPLVEALAVQMGRMRDAQHRVDDEGLIVADERGVPVEHPALSVERLAHVKVRELGAELAVRRRGRE